MTFFDVLIISQPNIFQILKFRFIFRFIGVFSHNHIISHLIVDFVGNAMYFFVFSALSKTTFMASGTSLNAHGNSAIWPFPLMLALIGFYLKNRESGKVFYVISANLVIFGWRYTVYLPVICLLKEEEIRDLSYSGIMIDMIVIYPHVTSFQWF